MHCRIAAILAAAAWLLGGCSTTIQSQVTAFHQWPAGMMNQSFGFQRSAEEENSLEYQHYEDQVKIALEQQGLSYAARDKSPTLTVDVDAGQTARDVTVIEPVAVDPFWHGSPFHSPFYGPFGYYGAISPFWHDPWYATRQREVRYPLYRRRLHVTIQQASTGKKLYEGTAVSEGRTAELAKIMPYLVEGLFSEFPGPSGVPRQVRVQVQ